MRGIVDFLNFDLGCAQAIKGPAGIDAFAKAYNDAIFSALS